MKKKYLEDLNLDNLKNAYEKSWLDELAYDYGKFLNCLDEKKFLGMSWFDPDKNKGMGNHYLRRNENLDQKDTRIINNINSHFNNLVYLPNIFTLDLLLTKKTDNIIFIDNGSGFGIMSAMLKKINIHCFNYDTYEQLFRKKEMAYKTRKRKAAELFFTKYDITPPEYNIDNFKKIYNKLGNEKKIYINSAGATNIEFLNELENVNSVMGCHRLDSFMKKRRDFEKKISYYAYEDLTMTDLSIENIVFSSFERIKI
tara:strand:+ start:10168 stop:10935 length:768 start_codon:yes stop_codon:yes gene_type:complete